MLQTLSNSDNHKKIEEKVSERPESYRNLDPAALYTSLEDFSKIFSHPLVKGTFLDLGCGLGQGCLLYSKTFPDRNSIGLELESSRVEEGIKQKHFLGLNNVELKIHDLLIEATPLADTYFLYFPTGPILDKLLTELYSQKRTFTLVAIESHGDLLPRLEFENWLELEDEIPLSSQRHYPNAKVYVSTQSERKVPEAFLYSYQELELVIEDEHGLWIGDSKDLYWAGGANFNLLHPPRTINWGSVKTLKGKSEFDQVLQHALSLRVQGEVIIETFDRVIQGFIRKIYISPVFHLEISNGEKVELSQIKKINIRT